MGWLINNWLCDTFTPLTTNESLSDDLSSFASASCEDVQARW